MQEDRTGTGYLRSREALGTIMLRQIPATERYALTINRCGADRYTKTSYPFHCGIYSEIVTPEAFFHFNLNNEIIRIIGRGTAWPHPQEWLKRTCGNDWVYYSTGGYTGVFETTGEYYLPNLSYPTNKSMGGSPLELPEVRKMVETWYPLLQKGCSRLQETLETGSDEALFLDRVLENSPERLRERTERLLDITGGHISVLPPDTRHVDYNVIPVAISRGCLYKCTFCRVKNEIPFHRLPITEIEGQLDRLQAFFGPELGNGYGLFLGEHDGLAAGPARICYGIEEGYRRLGLTGSFFKTGMTFMFGSVSSLLGAPGSLFAELERLPGRICINIGFESADQRTLDQLGKPISESDVIEAFLRSQEINDTFQSVEITANFVIDETLPATHFTALSTLLRDRVNRSRSKGSIYLSPMQFEDPRRSKLFLFYRYKCLSRLPLFLYTIQRW
ncbi:MAG: radical SAM domain-containing protein [Proteobacteria bacterium]|nr:MAG: radical SAM domain-containing protein [Pseudomonadota bacterium]PIE65179.1 MAG: radical SAM domain-containing protein [Desulfobacterales bacterium]